MKPLQLKDLEMAPQNVDENVWSYPRPPALQRCSNLLTIIWLGKNGREIVLARTEKALRVIETSHPPTYYLPLSCLQVPITPTSKKTFCEWKGIATYYSIRPDPDDTNIVIQNRIWAYLNPSPGFELLKDYVSFYASSGGAPQQRALKWRCFVDGEAALVQEGDFYGGWITKNIKGDMKGGPGTEGW